MARMSPAHGISYAPSGREPARPWVSKALDDIVKELAVDRKVASGVVWDEVAVAGLAAKGYEAELRRAGFDLPELDVPARLPFIRRQSNSTTGSARLRVDRRLDDIIRTISKARTTQAGKRISGQVVWNETGVTGLLVLGHQGKLTAAGFSVVNDKEAVLRAS